MAQAAGAAAGELPLNHRLLRWGLSVRVARDATNPGFAGAGGMNGARKRRAQAAHRAAQRHALPCCTNTHALRPCADPFPPTTTTLDNPAYRWFGLSLMKVGRSWQSRRQHAQQVCGSMPAQAAAVGSPPAPAAFPALGLPQGKLDWVLLRRLRAVTTQVGRCCAGQGRR